MKKVLFTIALIFGAVQFSNAQISYGIKGGLNFATLSDAVVVSIDEGVQPKQSVDSNTSYHAGAWMRFKVPVLGLYVRPEIVYTSISSTLPIPSDVPVSADYQLNRLDFPVLVGMKLFGVGNVFAGPVFEYVLKSDLDAVDTTEELKSITADDFFVGMQIGVGLEFWKLGLDIRYETAFSTNTSDFAPSSDPSSYLSLDNSPDQFIVGLSYKF